MCKVDNERFSAAVLNGKITISRADRVLETVKMDCFYYRFFAIFWLQSPE
jgi:hypothetical protein